MKRFRATFPRDEQPRLDGDGAFIGVDMVSAPDKLPPGVTAAARNRIFDDGECRTRKGCASMLWSNVTGWNFDMGPNGDEVLFEPVRAEWDAAKAYIEGDEVRHVFGGSGPPDYFRATGNIPPGEEPNPFLPPPAAWEVITGEAAGQPGDTALFNKFREERIYGAGRFGDPNGYEWLVVLLEDRALFARQFRFPEEYLYPAGIRLSDHPAEDDPEATLTQAFEKLILWRGEDGDAENPALEPLVFTFATGWQLMSEAEPGEEGDITLRLPNARRAVYFGNRLWVPFGRDSVAASDLLSTRWDPQTAEERINFGDSDEVTGLYAYDRTTLLAFKNRQIFALLNARGDLGDLALATVSREVGCIAPDTIAGYGRFVAFLGDNGIWTLDMLEDSRLAVPERPLSHPIQPLIDGINWNRAGRSQAIVHDGRLFIAVPWKDSPFNDTVLVYNINRQVWEGHWNSVDWKIRRWVKALYFGKTRLFFWHEDGFLVLMEHGDEDEIGNERHEITSKLVTRGFNSDSPERLRGLRLFVNLAQQRSDYTVTTLIDQVGRETNHVVNRQPADTRRRLIGQRPWVPTNINDDFNEEGRENYTVRIPGPAGLFYLLSGVRMDLLQEFEEVFPLRREGRYAQAVIENQRGQLTVQAVRLEARAGRRDSREKGY